MSNIKHPFPKSPVMFKHRKGDFKQMRKEYRKNDWTYSLHGNVSGMCTDTRIFPCKARREIKHWILTKKRMTRMSIWQEMPPPLIRQLLLKVLLQVILLPPLTFNRSYLGCQNHYPRRSMRLRLTKSGNRRHI